MSRLPAPGESLDYGSLGNPGPRTSGSSLCCPGTRQEQLADDLLGLAQTLTLKLEDYSSCPSAASADPEWAQESGNAVAWMKTTVEDLTATIVGLQAMPGKCDCHQEL